MEVLKSIFSNSNKLRPAPLQMPEKPSVGGDFAHVSAAFARTGNNIWISINELKSTSAKTK